MDTKSFDGDRFNTQTSHQDLLLENCALRQEVRDLKKLLSDWSNLCRSIGYPIDLDLNRKTWEALK
jgi:hypothetical protein